MKVHSGDPFDHIDHPECPCVVCATERDRRDRATLANDEDNRGANAFKEKAVGSDSDNGALALCRIRERAAKQENEKLKKLLGWALGAAEAFILACAGSGPTPQKLDAMDRLHNIREEAKRLGVE